MAGWDESTRPRAETPSSSRKNAIVGLILPSSESASAALCDRRRRRMSTPSACKKVAVGRRLASSEQPSSCGHLRGGKQVDGGLGQALGRAA
eukprot:scaffold232417_cov32-Tisochrysis_lutea.AAC.2